MIPKILVLVPLLFALPSYAGEDPFRWLEEIDSARSLEWVGQQNSRTEGRLEKLPLYSTLHGELTDLLGSTERLPTITFQGEQVYTLWQDDAHPRGLWQRTSFASYAGGHPQWELLLDLDELNRREGKTWVWKDASCLKPAGERCLLSLSPGGGDAVEIREFDLATKDFVPGGFRIPVAKTDASWVDANTLLIGTDFGPGTMSASGYALVNKRWKRGTPLAAAEEVFHGESRDMSATSFVQAQPGWQPEFHVRNPSFFETQITVVLPGGESARLPLPQDASLETTIGDLALFTLHSELRTAAHTFPVGSLVAYPLLRAREGAGSLDGLELVFKPTGKRFLSHVARSGETLLLSVLDNVRGKVLRGERKAKGWQLEEIRMGENGMADVLAADGFSDTFLATYTDFLTPTAQFRGNSRVGVVSPLRSSPAYFNASGEVTEQLESTSRDGTKIPYFVIHAKNMPLNGANPTVLYGYGGFQISLSPSYLGTVGKAWLEKGGVYVVANIRGGGEFGPAWHEAALKQHRQRAYDDFISVAENLIARKITSPAHLGIEGGSNGGLLVGAVFVERPDLFNAVLCQVPLLDMLRYHRLLAGNSWMGEYGNPDVAAERAAILRYSPYQNVKAVVSYPEVFFTTSTRDDRVHPGHARKMAALMEAQGHPVYFFENTEGGHGGSATPEQRAHLLALEFTYLWSKLAP